MSKSKTLGLPAFLLVFSSLASQAAVIDIRIQFQDSSLTRVPSANWNSLALPNPNVLQTVSTLVDFNTGEPTTVHLDASGWETRVGHSARWLPADFVSWIEPEVTTGGWRISTNVSATIALTNLPAGFYNLEFLATAGGALSPQGVNVDGGFTSNTFHGTNVSSSNYIARDLGQIARDWLIWEEISPDNGRINIGVERFGNTAEISAIRLVSVPEPSMAFYALILILGLVGVRLRR